MKKQLITFAFLVLCVIMTGFALYKAVLVTGNALDLRTVLLGLVDDKLKVLASEEILLKQDQIALERERIQAKRGNVRFWLMFQNVGAVACLLSLILSMLIVALAYKKHQSIHVAQIKDSSIPIRHQDLSNALPIMQGLVVAAQLEARADTTEQAVKLYALLSESVTAQIRGLVGRRGIAAIPAHALPEQATEQPPAVAFHVPTFAELYKQQEFTPGKPLLFGYAAGADAPQYRKPSDIKSMAIAGWQGSGKTLSLAYIVTCVLLQYPTAQAYVIDPHKGNEEGLGFLLAPLATTGRLHLINPFDTPKLIDELNATVDARLAGASTEPMLLLVIDELARLAKMDYFDGLLKFIERCTEETRKTNILFFGCSQKWNAKHFNGRADIRGCMNSMLIHKTKPSQAKLLMEGGASEQMKMLKQITQPGTAFLSTSNDADPTLVRMPYISAQDIHAVADVIANGNTLLKTSGGHPPVVSVDMPADNTCPHLTTPVATGEAGQVLTSADNEKDISFLAQIREFIQRKKQHDPTYSQNRLAAEIAVDPPLFSKILNGKRPLTAEQKTRLECLISAVDTPTDSACQQRKVIPFPKK